MKLAKFCFVVLLVSAVPQWVHAQQLKIGLVDFQVALNEVEAGKRAKAGLKAQFDAKQKSLEAKQNQLKQLKDTLEGQKAALSADAMRQKEAEYRDIFMDLQKTLATYRNEMATKEAELTQSIITKLRVVVSEIGQKESFNLIFEKSGEAVLYAPSAQDITQKVVQAFNSKP